VHKRLNELQRAPRMYPPWLSVLSLGAACAAFSTAGQRPGLSIVCAFVGAALGHTLRLSMLARRLPLVSIVVACAFVSCSAAELSAWPLSLLSVTFGGGPVKSGVATVASVLYLIPGVPLVNSLIDLIHLDLSAGLSRAAYAAVLTGSIAVGVFGFFALAGLFQ
jgi:uncharacterized membrane protein YjjP (DUF1212 family)